jgi:hypothetical protein
MGRVQYLSFATIPTPLISNDPLPLKFLRRAKKPCMAECLSVDFRQEPVYFTPPEAKFLVPDW